MPRRARTISGEINVAFISTSNFYFSREEQSPPTASQFTVHPAITWIAITSFFLYCFACYNELSLSSDNRFAVLFGWLSSVSLASILCPDFSPALFLLFGLFLAGVLLNLRPQALWNWVQQRMRPNSIHEQRIPVWNMGRGQAYPWINPEWSPELLNLRVEQLLWNGVHQRMSRNLDIPHLELHIRERHRGPTLTNLPV